MFRTCSLSIIRSISTLYTRSRYLSCEVFWRLLEDAKRTRMTNIYCVYTVLRYSWWWTVDISETCRVLYQINWRNSTFLWLSLQEYITMYVPLNVKFASENKYLFCGTVKGKPNPSNRIFLRHVQETNECKMFEAVVWKVTNNLQ